MATNNIQAQSSSQGQSGKKMLVIDIGKQKRKKVKKLKNGEGPLVDEIEVTVEQLKNDGVLDADAQTVVVVVRQKPRSNWMF